MKIQFQLNGAPRQVEVDPERSLLSVLRDDLDLTGAKYGCGEGQCGACTVLIDGEMRRSCITPAQTAAGRRITTVEGIEHDGRLHPLQQAFLDADALQCGYCTPGMIMAALGLLQTNPRASEAEILHHMEGSVCRCGAHPRILKAIKAAAKQMQEARR
jgi:isoquinoline 1-oxidoreductase subunit alpha